MSGRKRSPPATTYHSPLPSSMDITRIQRSLFYRYQYVTGPKCVLVTARFGKTPPNGPTLIRLLAMDRTEAAVQFDLSNHVSEILAGVARAKR